LVNVLQRLPATIPVLATTATANDRVVADERAQLGKVEVQRGPLTRATLALQTLRLPDQSARLAWLAAHLPDLPGTGLVYTLTTRDADEVATWLNRQGIAARAYYGDVAAEGFASSDEYRRHLEDELLANRIKALVATTTLGMGYDKPDLGFVVHYQAPGSIVAYYQQVGRAGRAIDRAVGVLFAGREDDDIHAYFRGTAFPAERDVQAVLDVLAEHDSMTEREIEAEVNLRKGQLEKLLKFLSVDSPAPVIKDGAAWRRTPVAWQMDHDRIRRLTGQREHEWQEVQRYIDTRGCLMQFLAEALDDANLKPCGRCARCLGRQGCRGRAGIAGGRGRPIPTAGRSAPAGQEAGGGGGVPPVRPAVEGLGSRDGAHRVPVGRCRVGTGRRRGQACRPFPRRSGRSGRRDDPAALESASIAGVADLRAVAASSGPGAGLRRVAGGEVAASPGGVGRQGPGQ
jgi:ATP-dependent DNA helicase RecQ